MKTLTDIRGKREYTIPLQEKVEPNGLNAPTTLLLQRKYIRNFPGNVQVAVYYSTQLKKYVTIPFSDIQQESINEAEKPPVGPKEMDNISIIQHVVATDEETEVEFNDGTRLDISPDIANCVLATFARLSKENRAKFEEALNNGSKTFIKMVKFCQKNQS